MEDKEKGRSGMNLAESTMEQGKVVEFVLPKKKRIKQLEPTPDQRKYVVLPIEVLDYQGELTASMYRVLLRLASFTNRAGLTWVSQQRIAKDLGVSKQFVSRVMAKLEKIGIIETVSKHFKNQKGKTVRLIFDKSISSTDAVITANEVEDSKTPEMKEKERQEILSGPYDDLTETMKMPKEMLEKNRMYSQQLMKVFGSKNIRKGGLNRIGEGFDKVEHEKLKQMIQENIMKAKKKKSQPKKEKGQPLEVDNKKTQSTSRGLLDSQPLEGDQTPYVNDIDNLVNIYINKNLKVTNGSSTYKVTEDDMKALELMIEDGRVTEKMYSNAVNRSKDKTIKEIVVEIADDLI